MPAGSTPAEEYGCCSDCRLAIGDCRLRPIHWRLRNATAYQGSRVQRVQGQRVRLAIAESIGDLRTCKLAGCSSALLNQERRAQLAANPQSAMDKPQSAVATRQSAIGRFQQRVLSAVRRIPVGRVATYGDVAAAAGRPRAARAVGKIMRACTARDVPCHRVIAAGGRLGGYGGSPQLKRALLKAEGIVVSGERIREFQQKRWIR
jgi:methylated-DNA-[protein]-cysteine S-methyltransferase